MGSDTRLPDAAPWGFDDDGERTPVGSDITPQQVREALAGVDAFGWTAKVRNVALEVVVEAARAWVDLHEEDGSLNRERLEAAVFTLRLTFDPTTEEQFDVAMRAAVLAFLEGKKP